MWKPPFEEFGEEYADHVVEAEEELEELFDRKQYPSSIVDYFSFDWKFFILDLPSGEFGILSPSHYEEEKEKLRDTIVEARELPNGKFRYHINEMYIFDGCNIGLDLALISKKETAYLLVSPIMETGLADYEFDVWRFRFCRW